MAIINANDNNFSEEVLESQIPVLVDFWAPWCGPCKAIAPTLETIADENLGKLKVVKVNVDENIALATQYKIISIPALKLFKNGQIKKEILGAVSKPALLNEIQEFL